MNHDVSRILIGFCIFVLCIWGWFANVIKLTNLDFEAPYKAETFRSIGVLATPIGVVLGFVDFGEEE